MTELPPRGAVDSLPPTGAKLPSAGDGARSAGEVLRAARERQDLHLDVLAATIKVSAAKLQALEDGRYDELPNATFVRALAQSVCRSLKIDPRPVLAMLPLAEAPPLEGQVGRLNTPFREPQGRGSDVRVSALSAKPLFVAAAVLLLAAVAVYFVPPSLWKRAPAVLAGGSAAPVAVTTPSSTSVVVLPPANEPTPQAAPQAAAPTAPAGSASAAPAAPEPPASAPAALPEPAPALPPPGALQIAATATSWIEIVDGEGRVVLSRTFQPGESLGLDAPLPLRVKVGNVAGTRLTLRGQVVDLAAVTRDNVARIELR